MKKSMLAAVLAVAFMAAQMTFAQEKPAAKKDAPAKPKHECVKDSTCKAEGKECCKKEGKKECVKDSAKKCEKHVEKKEMKKEEKK